EAEPVPHPYLAAKVCRVHLHGAGGDRELARDVLVAIAEGDETKHHGLAWGHAHRPCECPDRSVELDLHTRGGTRACGRGHPQGSSRGKVRCATTRRARVRGGTSWTQLGVRVGQTTRKLEPTSRLRRRPHHLLHAALQQ